MKRIVMIAIPLLVIVIGLAAFFILRDSGGETAAPDVVIATVDGIPIYESAANSRIEGINAVHEDAATAMGSDWKQTVIQSLVDDVIMQQEAERLGVDPTPVEVDAEVAALRVKFSEDGGWDEFLESQGMTEAEIERRIRLQMVGARIYNAATEDAVPTEDDLVAYYEANQADFTVNGDVRAFLEVRNSIEDEVTKRMKDTAYLAWIDGQRGSVTVVVVSDAWK